MAELKIGSPGGYFVAVVDDVDCDALALHTWNMAGGKGSRGKYAATSMVVNSVRTTVYMHRLVAHRMGLLPTLRGEAGQRGKWNISVDHINGDKLDNRRTNLRLRTRPQQMTNANDALRSTNKSGYRGVSYVKSRERFGKPWTASVTVNYRHINLGWCATVEEANAARLRWDGQHRS